MFDKCIKNHEVLGALTQNSPQLDKDKSTVSTILVFLVDKYAAITTQKNSCMECLSFCQQIFVFAHLLLDILIKSTKLHFQSWRKSSSDDFALFPQND